MKKSRYDLENHPAHPDTLPSKLAHKSIEELEALLLYTEQRKLDAEMNAADEKGLKQFSTYGGATMLAAMISASLADAPSSLITFLGSIALGCLIFGYLGLRYASRTITLQSRKNDVERIKRNIDFQQEKAITGKTKSIHKYSPQ